MRNLTLFSVVLVCLCNAAGASRSASVPNHPRNNSLWNAMKVRHERLRTAATTTGLPSAAANESITMTNCPTNFVNTNNEYGRTGNAMIEFAHMLWFAAKTKRTAIVPQALLGPLSQFDLKTLRLVGCFVYPVDMNPLLMSDTYNILHMKARELFQIEDLVKRAQELPESHIIPSSSEALSLDLAKFVSRVFNALWCCPNQQLFDYAFHVISHSFGDLRYAAIHKRGFEGSCASIITTATVNLTDAEIQLPLDAYNTIHPFRHNASYHPLCELENTFVVEIMNMHHREGTDPPPNPSCSVIPLNPSFCDINHLHTSLHCIIYSPSPSFTLIHHIGIPIYVATDGQYPSDIVGTFLNKVITCNDDTPFIPFPLIILSCFL